jgi:predicted MPP superfamily phosphohydrolase
MLPRSFFTLLASLVLVQSADRASGRLGIPTPTGGTASAHGHFEGEQHVQATHLTVPVKEGSVRFAIIGDNGTGERRQYEVGQEMARFHETFPFDFVIMLGDNIYGGKSPVDFKRKFEDPYRPLLDSGVKFYASLGNHDDPNERFYKPFNMGGKRFYSFKTGKVEFFALDSNYMDAEQLNWFNRELQDSNSTWKICYFHHPLYSEGKFHGPDTDLRQLLEPLLERYGVNVVFSGHEHIYERIRPQHGIYYFVLGNSGELRSHNLKRSAETAKGFDTDRAFMLIEIAGDELYFQTVTRTGETVDAGILEKQKPPISKACPCNPSRRC